MVMLSATTASAFDYVVTGNAAPEMEGKMFYLLDDNSNLVDSTKKLTESLKRLLMTILIVYNKPKFVFSQVFINFPIRL